METTPVIHSMGFGRAFWLDEEDQLCSCPWLKDGTVEEENYDYVSEWTDWEGVDMAKIFGIYRTMAAQFHYDEILKLKGLAV